MPTNSTARAAASATTSPCGAAIPVGAVDEVVEGVLVDGDVLAAQATVDVVERALQQEPQVVGSEGVEPEQRRPRQERTGEREERVLGGRPDEHHEPLLHVG